ncbi:hypothetical protein ACFVJ4_01685 [Streptomyces sp. NPDC127178]|uniref:hypothetical protein n=1 Tax=unclassified Streptomyces TaxID=2593676 RepID=UPI00363F105C
MPQTGSGNWYELFLEHQPDVSWREFARYGANPGTQVLAVTLTLEDGREMLCSLVVGMSPEVFSVESDIGVDDPDAENGYRYLLEIPESLAESLDAFIPAARPPAGSTRRCGTAIAA